MTQLILNIEDASILPSLKKILKALNGVSVVSTRKMTDMDYALEDKAKGRVIKCKDKEDLFNQLGL